MALLSFLAMYGLMYAMVDSAANVYPNLNQLYMAGLMTVPMVLLELALMGSMYDTRKGESCQSGREARSRWWHSGCSSGNRPLSLTPIP